MMYLTIIFASPLYFLIRGKWAGFCLNATLYGLACVTLLAFGIGILFWALGVGHAMWHLRRELMEEHATLIAEKMVQARVDLGR